MRKKSIRVPLAVPLDVKNCTVGAINLRYPTRADVRKILDADDGDPFAYSLFALSVLSRIDADTLQNLDPDDFIKLIALTENLVRKKASAPTEKDAG